MPRKYKQTASSKLNYTVYAIRCIMNGRVYIGVSGNVEQRIKTHFAELLSNYKKSFIQTGERSPSLWQIDFTRYGPKAFDAFILEDHISYEDRRVKEQYWIEKYRSLDPRYGYNTYYSVRDEQTFQIMPGKPPLPPAEI